MKLFKVKNKSLTEVSRKSFGLEKEIQSLVESNTEEIFNLEFVSSEFSIKNFRIDSLCFDNEKNSFVIIEYKKGSSYSVIDQGYSYLSIMLNNKSDFILEYNESRKNNLKREDVDWSQSKIIFVSPSFNNYQKNSVNFKDVPFELWEIRKFSDNIVSFNQQLSSSKESIQMVEGGKNTVIKNVSKEVKVYDEDHHLKSISEKNKQLYMSIKEELINMDEVEFVNTKNYIGFKKNNTIVSYINFFKNSLRFDLVKGNIKQDGSKSKGFFNLDDPKKVSKVVQIKFKSGVKREYYNIKISGKEEVGYLIMLLKQKYDSL
tara:strand:- start:121 stop:1071 length:951 start_codon:yes stop_codon:yes gene_type:complete